MVMAFSNRSVSAQGKKPNAAVKWLAPALVAAAVGFSLPVSLRVLVHDLTTAEAETAVATSYRSPETTGVCLSLATGDDPAVNRERPDPTTDERKCLLRTEPSPYVDVVCKTVLGLPRFGAQRGRNKIVPYVPVERAYGDDWPPTGLTMIGNERLEQFRASIEEVNRNGVPGAIVEMGVWRGGAMLMAAACQKEYKSSGGTIDRNLFLFDAFEEIPENIYRKASKFLFNTEKDVKGVFESLGLIDSNVHFRKGLFQKTVPQMESDPLLSKIAVYRIDGNFYDSYSDALYYGYEKVPVGGIIIFDDVMSHPQVMNAWLDFKSDQGLPESLNRIDRHSAWFRKEKNVKVDKTKMKPPQDINIP